MLNLYIIVFLLLITNVSSSNDLPRISCYRISGVPTRNNDIEGEAYKSSLRFIGKTNPVTEILINQAN
ncbi:unnamed protein product, partial [Adineta steineri]